jgi:transposase
LHVGLDAHKKQTVGFVVHADGKREGPFAMQTTRESIERLAPKWRGGEVLVEASTTGKGVVRLLRDLGVNAKLVHPNALMMTLRRSKDDEEDALHIALVGKIGAAHEAYLATPYEDELRSLTRRRYDVKQRMSSLSCQAHAILARNLVTPPPGRPTRGSTRRRWENAPGLPERERYILRGVLRELDYLEKEHDEIRLRVHEVTKGDEQIDLLLTIPGIDIVNAATIRGEYGDIKRFPSGKHAASYAGIVPPNWRSGDKELHGRITKKGSPYLRAALVEAAHQAARWDSPLKRFLKRLTARVGMKKAITAVGRKLATLIWSMLTHDKPYADQAGLLTGMKRWRRDQITELLAAGDREAAAKRMNYHNTKRDYERRLKRTAA